MTLSSEEYCEYYAVCDKCGAQVLEVIEYMDVKNMDDRCGVCSRCRKLFCGECVVEDENKDKIFCPNCRGELIDFWGCSPYDLIDILIHDCQPFVRKEIVQNWQCPLCFGATSDPEEHIRATHRIREDLVAGYVEKGWLKET